MDPKMNCLVIEDEGAYVAMTLEHQVVAQGDSKAAEPVIGVRAARWPPVE